MFIKKIFRKKKPRLRKEIILSQNEGNISIAGTLSNPNYNITQLILEERGTGDRIVFDNEQEGILFTFNFSLINELKTMEDTIYDLYLNVKIDEENLTVKQRERNNPRAIIHTDKDNHVIYEYPIRLGRFDNTITKELTAYKNDERKYLLYKTTKGNLSISVNKEVHQKYISQIDYLKMKKNNMIFGGKLFTRTNEVERLDLVIIGRDNSVRTTLPLNFTLLNKATEERFGLNRYTFSAKVNLDELFSNDQLNEDIYDFYFEISFRNIENKTLLRMGRPRFRARYKLKSGWGTRGKKILSVSPYYTIKAFNLSVQVEEFEKESFLYLLKLKRWAFFVRLFNKSKKIWLVGERPYKAQDTGYHFFKHMREKYPEKNVYYVIEKDSPELVNVEKYGNIVYFKSKEHIKNTIIANRIISSHHPDYLFPLRTKEFKNKIKAKKIFIQHGVLGTKNIEHFYGKSSPSFETDLFMVSSEYEKDIVINDFGYKVDEVAVTGLSRFDSLFKEDVELKRQILIIPTWREWLVRDDLFLESEYYNRYSELVNNDELKRMSEEYSFKVVLCLHPNMQKFSNYFQNSWIEVIYQGEIDVQVLMKESLMMITDYSSVAFDFSFLNKPIIYYQFDRSRFIGRKGSHLDLDNDLPGDIVTNLDEILISVQNYAQVDFKMKESNQKRAKKFLTYKDQNSSERIYQAINNQVKRKPLLEKITEHEISVNSFNIFRRSKYYFPTMKLFYKIARRVLPTDNNLILFESGLGEQYGDSPKNIYEEIIKNDLPYKKVWVSNKRVRFSDRDTFRIKRLSPSYYYYLAKAKVWINNQNFPTYIEKPSNTIFLQTWHGTPLKKMLYDIETIKGRSDDYLDRVSLAVKNWDYLISPSSYATKAFKSAFRHEAEILEVGYPRNDIFYKESNEKLKNKIKKSLNIPFDKKIILYTPTFRDNRTKGLNKFMFDMEMDYMKMAESLSDDYVVLLRTHVVIKSKIKITGELDDFIIDVSNYPEVQELLLIADVLITDYSSVMFDFANTNKPMLFFTYDFETYRDEVRGFYMDFENEAPGPLLKNTAQLIDSIVQIKDIQIQYKDKYKLFKEKYCYLEDGNASQRVVKEIFIKD